MYNSTCDKKFYFNNFFFAIIEINNIFYKFFVKKIDL